MAIAVDASTPVRWTATLAAGGTQDSASFTAPTDAFLVACLSYDGNDVAQYGSPNFSDSGGLAWNQRVIRTLDETTAGGGSTIYTARTTSSVSRTARFGRTGGSEPTAARYSCKLFVFTGVDVDGTPVDTVGASNEGGNTTNNSMTTTSVTPGGTGKIVGCDTEWNQRGTMTSSDMVAGNGGAFDQANYSGAIDVIAGYKNCTSGVGVTLNFDAGGSAAPQHKWCQIIVREAASPKARPVFHNSQRFFRRRAG